MGTHRRAAATMTVATVLLASAACGSQDKPQVKIGADATPSSSSSPSATAQAAPPKPQLPAATTNTPAGRIAFASYFVKSLNYAYASNDASPVVSVGATGKDISCTMCTDLEDYLKGQKAKGQHLEPSNLPVLKVLETARLKPNVWVLDVQSRASARADVDATGTKVKRYPAKKNFIVEVGVAWEHHGYRVTGWKAGENK